MHAVASAAVLFLVATASRVEVNLTGKQDSTGQAGVEVDHLATEPVCEDDTIWDKIMASPDVNSIRAIPWNEVSSLTVKYLSQKAVLIANLETEIKKLSQTIKVMKEAKVSQEFNDEQIQSLITQSVETEGSYGSVEDAKNSACGKPGKTPRVPFDALDLATDSIPSFARPLLSTGEHKSLKSQFIDVCKLFLDAGEDQLTNYCGQLCVNLAEVVQGISDQHSNSNQDTAILEKKLNEKQQELIAAKTDKQQCQRSQQTIESFHQYLDSLDQEINVRHKAVRKAEYDLDSAQWALTDLEDKLATQKQMVDDAQNLLEGDATAVVEAKEAFTAVSKDMEQIIEQIGLAKDLLNKLREELSNMKKASEVILEIKKYVSTTTLKMGYFVDVAVREPVRQIGLDEKKNVWDFFSSEVSNEECATTFKNQLTGFHQYCTGPAMAAFEHIKHIVDLTPLCNLGEKNEIEVEEDAAVQGRIKYLTRDLQNVQSWLDPFRGTHMTKAMEQEKIDSGEPEGLRRVMGVYGTSNFYTGYLIDWKINGGKFLGLLEQMKNQIQALETDIEEEESLVTGLHDALEALTTEQQSAQGKLDVALAQHAETLNNKNELESKQQEMKKEMGEMKNTLTDLEAALALAMEEYQKARKKLVEEHTAGKNDVFALSELHEGGLVDMQ